MRPNRLPAGKPRSLFARIFAQFNNLLIYVLLASSIVTILLRHVLDAVVILAVIVINGGDRVHSGGAVRKSRSRPFAPCSRANPRCCAMDGV